MKRNQTPFFIINLFLVGGLIYIAGGLLADLIKGPRWAPQGITTAASARTETPLVFPTPRQAAEYKGIEGHRLFLFSDPGTASKTKTPPADPPAPLKTGFRLIGTIVTGSTAKKGLAIVQPDNQRQQRLIAVGDTIDGYEVAAVMQNRIVLVRQGVEYTLAIGNAPRAKRPVPHGGQVLVPPGTASGAISLNRVNVLKAIGNVGQVAGQIEVTPFYQNGRAQGLEIQNLAPDSIFNQMRLQIGDIISHISGYPVNSLEDAVKAYTKVKTATNLQLVLLRDGHRHTLNYVIQ